MASDYENKLARYQAAANASLQAKGFSPWTFMDRKMAQIGMEQAPGAPSAPWGGEMPAVNEYEHAQAAGYPSLEAYRKQSMFDTVAPAMKMLRRPNTAGY